ncbi:hypothetical protein QBC44DRAFT_111755 [Cladorrhinum sp. PSN332]|nr:hypothetical protein QBC44DRAFT_111755 [Cladorrhinum sp. PSN332]
MKSLHLLAFSLPIASATDYFFLLTSGNEITHSQRLRLNNSIPIISPGASAAPHNPADHFSRIYVNGSGPTSPATLFVVPTNPHPPPVPGYYGLSGQEGIPDAYRLIQSYRPQDYAPGEFRYDDWSLKAAAGGERTLLRYGTDDLGEWRWIAVRQVSNQGVERWVPWWVRPTGANLGNLTAWDYVVVELELVLAKGPVNSLAPGGVQE